MNNYKTKGILIGYSKQLLQCNSAGLMIGRRRNEIQQYYKIVR